MAKKDTINLTEDVYKENHEFLNDCNVKYIENEYIKLGFNIELGGAITYLAEHGKENMINSHDWGRQIQMSYYSGPSPFSPEGVRKRDCWQTFPWNPIQSGDCFFNTSKVVESRFDKDSAYIKCIPMQWALDNYPGDCFFEVKAKLNGKTVEVVSGIINNREDKNQYTGSTETPALYTNGRYYRGVTYLGDEPFTNAPLTVICDKDKTKRRWAWHTNYPSEYWMALVDDNDYGVGLYCPGTARVAVGFAPDDPNFMGWGTEKDDQTGYIAPFQDLVFDYNIKHEYKYTLILGDLNFIRQTANQLDAKENHKKFVFKDRRYSFFYKDIVDQGYPINGKLSFDFKPNSSILNRNIFIGKSSSKIILDADFVGEIVGKLVCYVYKGLNEFNEAFFENVSINFNLIGAGKRDCFEIDFSTVNEALGGFEIVFENLGHIDLYGIEIK